MGLGCGFVKPCVSVFAAEQLKDEHGNDASPKTLEKLYLWWYMAINIGESSSFPLARLFLPSTHPRARALPKLTHTPHTHTLSFSFSFSPFLILLQHNITRVLPRTAGSFVGPIAGPLLSGNTPDGLDNLLGYEKYQCTGNATIIDACDGYCPGGCQYTPPTPTQAAECCNGPRIGVNYWLVWGCWSLPMLCLSFLTFFIGAWRPGYITTPAQGSYLVRQDACVRACVRMNDPWLTN